MKFFASIAFVLTLLLTSCGGSNNSRGNINYKRIFSHNNQYKVEVPHDFSKIQALDDYLAFEQSKTNTILIIKLLKPGETLDTHLRDSHSKDNFDYRLYKSTSTEQYYKVTRGLNAFWNAYELHAIKIIGNTRYMISLLSDRVSRETMEHIIEHVQHSLIAYNSESNISSSSNSQNGSVFSKRNTSYYSIEYPSSWKEITNIDEMTDVYIGSEDNLLGFTIVCFDTDYTLQEVYNESKTNMINAGASIVKDIKTTINGMTCYLLSFEYNVSSRKVKEISYIFKKNDTMYCVKFGTDKNEVNSNMELINRIINSFRIK